VRNARYRAYVDSCAELYLDGSLLQLLLFLKTFGFIRRYHGPDLLVDKILESDSLNLIFGPLTRCGSLRNVLTFELPYSDDGELLASLIHERLVSISGETQFKKINLFISLGLPKQESVSLLVYDKLKGQDLSGTIEIYPVGAAVDFVFGNKKRAGKLVQIVGLEWLPRLLREPRMGKRIYYSILGSLYFVLKG